MVTLRNEILTDMELSEDIFSEAPDYNLELFYQNAVDEYNINQDNVHKIFSVFITIISLATPYTFTVNSFGTQATTMVLLAIFIIGIVLSTIVVHYHAQCEKMDLTIKTLTALMNVKKEKINSEVVNKVFYKTAVKKVIPVIRCNKKGKNRFKIFNVIKNNLGKSEYTLFNVMVVISSVFFILAGISELTGTVGNLNTFQGIFFLLEYVFLALYAAMMLIFYFNTCLVFGMYSFAVRNYEFTSLIRFERLYAKMKYLHFSKEE